MGELSENFVPLLSNLFSPMMPQRISHLLQSISSKTNAFQKEKYF
jgi:hypothetical protein